MDVQATGPRDVGAVVNAVHILRFLSTATEPAGVATVARGTGISPSTCFNILRTLARQRFVAFHSTDKTYTLGLAMAELAAGMIGISHAELIRPELERLALNYDMLIVLWRVTEDGHLILIDRAHSHRAIRVEAKVGLRVPMLVGGIGRCVAAALDLPPSELRRRFAALRWQSPPSFESYAADVAVTRERGWGLDNANLYRGMITVAALITDGNHQPRFGLSGLSIAGQHSLERLAELGDDLRNVATMASASLFPRRRSLFENGIPDIENKS